MTASLLLVAFGVFALRGAQVMGRVMGHCDVASTLLRLGAPRNQVSTWVCIAKWESSYNTGAVGPPNSDGSRDHGLFQINDRYWCSPPGRGCGISCKSLEDDDISNDWKCVQRIYKATKRQVGNGFKAWTTYAPHCAGDTSSYIAGCRLATSFVDSPNELIDGEVWTSYASPVSFILPWYRSNYWSQHQIYWNKRK